MDNLIVYVDDAAHAGSELAATLARTQPARVFVVACAPRMTQRIGKWVSHGTRENWRNKWSRKLFDQFLPLFDAAVPVEAVVAKGPLNDLAHDIQAAHGPAHVVDLRRPKSAPAAADAPPAKPWVLPGSASLWALFFVVME